MRRIQALSSLVVLMLLATSGFGRQSAANGGTANGEDAKRQRLYPLPRYEEDWSLLSDPQKHTDRWDSIKFLPLSADRSVFLSLGGEARETYERFHNTNFGLSPQDPGGYLLQRYLLDADLHYRSRLGFFAELSSSLIKGGTGGPRPAIDEDRLDLHQGFLDILLRSRVHSSLTLRVGRQEMALGSGRLVALREGPNVPLSFEGASLLVSRASWKADAFLTRPVESRRGIFDDFAYTGSAFWGIYSSHRSPAGRVSTDLYYFGLERERALFNQGIAEERRHTLGARIWQNVEGWTFDAEGMYQLGHFGSGTIRAWRLADDTAYRFSSIRLRPRIGLAADVSSGDRDPAHRNLETFNALFQSGTYSGRAQILGPDNTMRLEPNLGLSLGEGLTLSAGWGFFWRESVHDGLYGIAGNLIVPTRGVLSRYEGSRPTVQLDWQISEHLSAHVNYIYVFNAGFEEESVHGTRSMSFVSPWVTYRL